MIMIDVIAVRYDDDSVITIYVLYTDNKYNTSYVTFHMSPPIKKFTKNYTSLVFSTYKLIGFISKKEFIKNIGRLSKRIIYTCTFL